MPDEHVTLLCATGTHRQATTAEMSELVGPDIVARYTIIDHDSGGPGHVRVGEVDGTPVLLQHEYVEADARIITGFVEPHFFAGFSGGPKAVCPGLAATETILEAHHPRRIADARATFVTRDGNPVHDFVRAATALAPPHLSLDVAINRARRVTAVFAGPLPGAHDAACAHVESSAVREVGAPFDLVVSTNGGHPLDRNLYQAVKGMAAAERIVRDGGIIVMAAACGDGVPAGGAFARLLAGASIAGRPRRGLGGNPSSTAGRPRCSGRVLAARRGAPAQPRVWTTVRSPPPCCVPAADLDGAVADALARLGPGARVAVIPEGPLTVATARDAGRVDLADRDQCLSLTPVSGIESPNGVRRSAVRLRRPRGSAAGGGGAGRVIPMWSPTSSVMPGTGEGKPPPLDRASSTATATPRSCS